MRLRLDQIKPGMKIKCRGGLRTITGLCKKTPVANGRVIYSWWAEQNMPYQLPHIVGCGDVFVEVEVEECD